MAVFGNPTTMSIGCKRCPAGKMSRSLYSAQYFKRVKRTKNA